jgi:DNA topoisomerase-3
MPRPELSSYSVGQQVRAVEVTLRTGQTRPPPYFTPTTLVDAMLDVDRFVSDPADKRALKDAEGIGTARTRAECVQKLQRTEFCYLDGKSKKGGKKLPPIRPTARGQNLICVLRQQGNMLANPVMTAKWEAAMRMIERGQVTYDQFMGHQRRFVRGMVDNMLGLQIRAGLLGEPKVKRAPQGEIEPLPGDGSVCPECGKGTLATRKVTKEGSKSFGKRFLSCSAWKAGCKFSQWEDAADGHGTKRAA